MSAMTYLFFIKIKAMIRNIFSKPLSAIFTVLGIAIYLFAFISALSNHRLISQMMQINSMERLITMFIGFLLLLFSVMLFQKRTAIILSSDAFFIFSGPFSRKKILSYLLVETLKESVLFAFFAEFYLVLMGMGTINSIGTILFMTLHIIIIFYFLFLSITYIYFLDICGHPAFKIKVAIAAIIILFIGGIILKNMIQNGFNLNIAFKAFFQDKLFYFLPAIGWMKWALISFISGNISTAWIVTLLCIVVCAILTWLTLSVKGDFYERAINDAEWMTEYKKNAKEGKVQKINQKIISVENTNFGLGAKAIADKGFLEMKKTRSWIRLRDIGFIALYIAIAKIAMNSFIFYQYYILIILMVTVQTDSINDELKKHFIYLIPENPVKKLCYLLKPMLLRLFIFLFLALFPSIFVFGIQLGELITAFITTGSYGILFTAGSLWSLKILKSGTNAAAEQFLKMLFIMIAMIPAVIVTLIIFFVLHLDMQTAQIISSIASLICNIIIGILFLFSTKSMLNGTDMMKE